MHLTRNYSALRTITSDNGCIPKFSKSAMAQCSIGGFNADTFVPTLLVVSQPVRACTTGRTEINFSDMWLVRPFIGTTRLFRAFEPQIIHNFISPLFFTGPGNDITD